MEPLTNGVEITDSSKQANDAATGYDIKTYPAPTASLLSQFGLSVTAAQLVSAGGYLFHLTKAAGKSEFLLPRLFVTAQCVELCKSSTKRSISQNMS